MNQFLNELNPVQQAAATHITGASLVIAGAGSGKTRVLTYKIAYLLSKGIPAGSILALTFTNKAAKEMRIRIETLVGRDAAKYLWMGTFHAKFSTILRMEADKLGYPRTFTIYDTQDSKNLLKQIIKELKLDDKIYKTGDVLSRISSAKNNLHSSGAYLANAAHFEADRNARKPEIGRIFQIYEARCRQAGAMDFDDLLLNTNVLFRDHPEVLGKYQNRFRFILVDEYQDTNFAQYLIVKKLAAQHGNVCVVGDDAQSIYAFRGAKIENILNFRNDYPEYKLFKLEQNYRSTQTIVDAANSLIKKNKGQIPKKVFSENLEGEKIKLLKAYTDGEEGVQVANSIFDMRLRDQLQYSNFAILYRTNAQSRIMEESLRKRNIPYKIYGGLSFYQRKEIKDLISYFRLTINHNDEEAIRRVINYPARGIGKTTLTKLEEYAVANQRSIWDVLLNVGNSDLDLNKGTVSKLKGFTDFILQISEGIENRDAYESAVNIARDSGILKELHSENSPEGISRKENINELLNGIKEFVDTTAEDRTIPLSEFLENVALLTNQDNEKEEDFDKVTLMTIHSAKGLEFKHVFVVGLEEGLFPSSMSTGSIQELEEERRLFYVAITRAEDSLSLAFAKSRYKWGNLESCRPSRFLKEIEPIYLDGDIEESNATEDDIDFGFSGKPQFQQRNKPFGQQTGGSDVIINQVQYKKRMEVKEKVRRSPKSKLMPKVAQEKPRELIGFTKMDESHTSHQTVDPSKGASAKIKEGQIVRHEKFGKGKIISIEGETPNEKLSVEFEKSGLKTLLLKFAKLDVLG